MTITTTAERPSADDQCIACSARAGSCQVRQWLSGRPCCSSCTHPTTDQEPHR